jgi:hypothetical protein
MIGLKLTVRVRLSDGTLALMVALKAAATIAQEAHAYQSQLNQPGKDVQWVPTPPALVEKMLDMAHLTPNDRLVDLGSGDGVLVIAAARRGARARGIEYDPRLVEFSKRSARAAGVSGRTKFVRGDIFETDYFGRDRGHHLPAALDEPAAAADLPRPEAGHVHRGEYLRDRRLGAGRDRDDRTVRALVHGDALDRASARGRDVAHAERRPDADAAVSVHIRNAGKRADRERTP